MAIITFCGESFTVDHAVKGADYVHGYDVNGNLIISLDGVKNFSFISYDGTYMSPTECLAELCNDVKYCAGAFKKSDGTVLFASENGCYYRLIKSLGDAVEREWINPPMMLGVEYRTTERHNDKVVYVTRLTVGELLNKGTTTTLLPSTPTEIVELYGTAKSDAYTETVIFPIITTAGAIGARLTKEGTKTIHAKTFADYSGYVATATVKYTKD